MMLHESKSHDGVGDEMLPRSNLVWTGKTNGHHIKYAGDNEHFKEPQVNRTPPFSHLDLPEDHSDQDVYGDSCLAHLKLLHAIQALKEDIGYTDGLWGLWDGRANNRDNDIDDELTSVPRTVNMPVEEREKLILSKIREKRWALFVARAVDRYEAWWNSFEHEMLTEAEMKLPYSRRYMAFTSTGEPMKWIPKLLPPLDVLMVWHTHMLNPRCYLEDTMRHGLHDLWTGGIPWFLINQAVDTQSNYNVSSETRTWWLATTKRTWNNVDDSLTKTLSCPFCSTVNEIPWTTCGMDEVSKDKGTPGLVGKGYGDGGFSNLCKECNREMCKETLSIAKFVNDAKLLLTMDVTMPGTILNPLTGQAMCIPPGRRALHFQQTFPNRLIKFELRIKLVELLRPADNDPSPTMETVRKLIEDVLSSEKHVRKIDSEPGRYGRYKALPLSKLCTRKMMSRYWENFSPFALDLCGAVMRQGVFIEKMNKLDWMHSPSASQTMQRLVIKYFRFLDIIFNHTRQVVVPTLDVDLAWHTHQLSPRAYYEYVCRKSGKFIDHDDKIDEDKLNTQFEWTTKIYQETYGEVYSECTCWYCETIRSSQVMSVVKLLKFQTSDRATEEFYRSGRAKFCPPSNSAHISSHNAVRFRETNDQQRVTAAIRARQQEKLDRWYEKAVKRAEKKGRKLPPREEYYSHWGYSHFMYAPYMHPTYIAPVMYPGWDPCAVTVGQGAWANCAAGSCSAGAVANGACAASGGGGGYGGGGCGGGGGSC